MRGSDWEIIRELYETPNITKVAKKLYMTQPSLTKRLKSIENEMDISIVDRTTKGIVFTKQGEILARAAKKYEKFWNQVTAELKSVTLEEQETITLGVAYTFSKYELPRVLSEFTKNNPNIKFNIVVEVSDSLYKKVTSGEIDAAFIRENHTGDLRRIKISESKGYVLSKNPVELKDLTNLMYIDYKTNDRTKSMIENWSEEIVGTTLKSDIFAGYIDTAWKLVDNNLGYTCCFLPETFDNEFGLHLTPMMDSHGNQVARNTWFIIKKDIEDKKGLGKFAAHIETLSIKG